MILRPYSYNGISLTNNTSHTTDPSSLYDAYLPREYAGMQMPTEPTYISRAGAVPVFSGKDFRPVTIPLSVNLLGTFTQTYESLNQLFDTKDETPRQLIVVDSEDSNKQYYTYATAKSVQADGVGGPNATVILALDDPIWQSVTQNSQTFSVTDTTGSTSVTNNGNDYAYPVFEITPQSGSTDNQYSLYVQVVPTSTLPWPNRFLDITGATDTTWDTAALVSGGKMQSDGKDLRVFRDGVEVSRWLDGINTTDTHVIVSCDMPPRWWMGTKTAIGATDTVTEIEINDNTANRAALTSMPNAGRVLVYTGTALSATDTEEFTYTAKTITPTKLALTINSRAVRGTTALDHAAFSTVQHMPYDFTVIYGSASTDEPVTDNTKKPIQSLTSRNNSFVYDTAFYEIAGTRPNIWVPAPNITSNASLSRSGIYTSTNDAGDTDPATAIGLKAQTYQNLGVWNPDTVTLRWFGYFPDYVASVSASGAQNQNVASIPTWSLQSYTAAAGWRDLWTVSAQATTDYTTWTTWTKASSDATLPASTEYLRFLGLGTILGSTDYYSKVEVSAVTVGLTNHPDVRLRTEATNFHLDAKITNATTGEFFSIILPMSLNETVYVDTDPDYPTVTYKGRVTNGALSLSSVRAAWLKLNPGANTIEFQNNLPAATDVQIVIKHRDRANFL